MEPSKKSNKKWIIFGTVIAALAILIAVGPVLVTKYMRSKMPQPVRSELMIKVKGTVKFSMDKTLYLKGENGLYYVLFGDLTNDLTKIVDQKATVFGNIYMAKEGDMLDGNPVRMRINVTNYGVPDLDSVTKK